MWTRDNLKNLAKEHLRSKYWMAFLVTIIVGILGGGSGFFTWRLNGNFDFSKLNWNNFYSGDFGQIIDRLKAGFGPGLVAAAIIGGSFAALISLAYNIFISPVIMVGGDRWFSRNREAAAVPQVSQVFSLFRAGSYLKTVGSMLWMALFQFLWFLLFVIPGIIKAYSYRMTPWILADNPAIGYRRALKLSMDLTRGHKWNIFVLDLSFIGWYILGVLACGIGVIFVAPYYMAVQSELYATLRQEGVDRGDCTMEELGYLKVSQPTA